MRASSKCHNIRKLCLLLESRAHLVWKCHMCWTWFSVTCAYDIVSWLPVKTRWTEMLAAAVLAA